STVDGGNGPQKVEDGADGSPLRRPFELGTLPAAKSGAPYAAWIITVGLRGGAPAIEVSTREGTHLRVESDGTVPEEHTGSKQHGTTGQELAITREMRREGDLQKLVVTIENRGVDEEGIPGVRLATATGLVIETDADGRYHIADVDAGSAPGGRNFIVKADHASLPVGAQFTTENPRVLHLTSGLMSRGDSGVDPGHPGVPALTRQRQRAQAQLRFQASVQPWLVAPVWEVDRPETFVLGGDCFEPGSADLTK